MSVSSVAVDLAKRIFDRFDDKTVMLIGAGKMGDLMARHLQSHGVQSLMVTNRTFERAVELAEKIHGNPIRFEDFPHYLKMADLVIGCAGAPEVLVEAATGGKSSARTQTKGDVFHRYRRPAQLRRARSTISITFIFTTSTISRASPRKISRNAPAKPKKPKASFIEEVQSFVRWIGSLEQVPTITALRQRFDDIRRGEMEKSLGGSLKDLSAEQRAAVRGHDHGDDQ